MDGDWKIESFEGQTHSRSLCYAELTHNWHFTNFAIHKQQQINNSDAALHYNLEKEKQNSSSILLFYLSQASVFPNQTNKTMKIQTTMLLKSGYIRGQTIGVDTNPRRYLGSMAINCRYCPPST